MWKSSFYECISVRVVVMKKLSSCKGIIAVILFFLIMICFAGCQLWYQNLKGYLEHWTDTVQVKDFVVLSSPESQKNSSGFETISTYASVTATVNIINPENYSLDTGVGFAEDTLRSVRISGPAGSAVLPLTTVTSASPTSMEVQLAPLTQVLTKESLALEHTNFTVTFVPTRAENGLSALGAQNITLRYNTPPRSPIELVYDANQGKITWLGSQSWDIVQGTGTYLDDLIFWAWPSGITDPRHPDYVEKFEVYEDGVLFDSATAADFLMSNPNKSNLQSYIPQEIKAAGYDIYCSLGTSGSTITVCAVDSEGVRSQMSTSGIAPHKVILEANGGIFPSVGTTSVETYKAAMSLIIGSDLEVPFRDGYFLSGWSFSDGSAVSFPLSIDQPMTLTAQWQANPPASSGSGGGTTVSTYTVTYNDNGATSGTVPGTQNKIAGRAVTVAQNSGSLTKTGYTFNGWNTKADGTGTSYAAGSSFTDDADLTLYAQWKANTYTVTFSGGTGVSTSVTVTYDQTPPQITPPSPPTTGFSFKSYNTEKNGSGIDYYDGNGVGVGTWRESNNTTLYAQWDYEEPSKASDGTTYQISNAGNLLWISEALTAETITKFNIELTADIVVPEGEWVPINIEKDTQASTFNGNGHSITLKEATCGLFTNYNYSTVQNLVLKGSITASGRVGAVGVSMYRSTIENVMSEVRIIGTTETGGLVGQFGGGARTSIIKNCAVYADVNGGTETGGLVGRIWKGAQPATIQNSVYMGKVSGSTTKVGAIVGFNGNTSGTSILENIYYCEASELDSIGKEDKSPASTDNVVSKTADEIKNNGVSILGSAWELKTGASYPTLK